MAPKRPPVKEVGNELNGGVQCSLNDNGEKVPVNGSPENGKSPTGHLASNGVVGVGGDEDSSTCAGASVQVKSNGTMVFKKMASASN